ncbi:hypothetical protein PILCRDRAFT_828988 [Piloderma croceum F 1598]|uniref:Uncharacterized protein n=1 Tax=Piloderma croceum (strain F 1598) TaxID=765440 RepID=A0A0C3F112_PILCF|nr:hypothetical protein PILCRDRAFT_828988 [Piloderma croceum F 1598]
MLARTASKRGQKQTWRLAGRAAISSLGVGALRGTTMTKTRHPRRFLYSTRVNEYLPAT